MSSMLDEKMISVGQLSEVLRKCFSDTPLFKNLSVYGEIIQISERSNYSFFTLGEQGKANGPTINCAVNRYYPLNELRQCKKGDIVVVTGNLSYYQRGSSITLWAESINLLMTQMGTNLLKRRETLEKLDKMGYLDPARKRKIPRFCKRIAVITAPDSAAYEDIKKTLRERFPVKTKFFPCKVQGEGAARSIYNALKEAQKEEFDCILVGRGGGSKTDLSAFDDENLAIAVAECRIPTITCIGHTIDESVCDKVSDVKAITPTEGASLINPSLQEVIDFREGFKDNLVSTYRSMIKKGLDSTVQFKKHLTALSPKGRIGLLKEKNRNFRSNLLNSFSFLVGELQHTCQDTKDSIVSVYCSYLRKKREEELRSLSLLKEKSMEEIERRGLVEVYKGETKIKSSLLLEQDDEVDIVFADGRRKAKVSSTKE